MNSKILANSLSPVTFCISLVHDTIILLIFQYSRKNWSDILPTKKKKEEEKK